MLIVHKAVTGKAPQSQNYFNVTLRQGICGQGVDFTKN